METHTHFTSTQLEEIFAHIKDGSRHGSNSLYRGLVDEAIALGVGAGMESDDALRTFNALFGKLIRGILAGRVTVENFYDVYNQLISKAYQVEAEQMKAIYATRTNMTKHKNAERGYYTESYMFAVNHLHDLAKRPELMEKYGVTDIDIEVLKAYYSVVQNKLAKVAEHFGISLNEAKHAVLTAREKIKAVEEAEFINNVRVGQ